TYSVSFVASTGVTVTADQGTVGTNMITDIPAGTDVTITSSFDGCDVQTVTITAPECPATCQEPILTVGDLSCDTTGYTVSFISNGEAVTASVGVVDMATSTVSGVPFGTELTITATSGTSCVTTQSVSIPATCPTDCVQPSLS
ncbi:hypothetical protein, partial [Joostella sp. CR20]|uniref:hypothetical protein n=1 Tax=Joostella sp. CR20 TaxID=2804312 RepID=UPI00313B589C